MKKNSKQNPQEKKPFFLSYSRYVNLAIQMLVIIALGVWGGISLDKHLDLATPVFTILLSLSAVVIAIYLVIKSLLGSK